MITAMQANKYVRQPWRWRSEYSRTLNWIEHNIFKLIKEGYYDMTIEWFDDHGNEIILKCNGEYKDIGSLIQLRMYLETHGYVISIRNKYLNINWS